MNRYKIVYEHYYKRATTLATYTVMADSEEEAIEKIREGEGEQTAEEFVDGDFRGDDIKYVDTLGWSTQKQNDK